jgi:uncharacterized protein
LPKNACPEEGGSERTCIVTGAKGAPDTMLRFALAPGGSVVPDIRRKLPGRGVWTRLSKETVRRAVDRRAFGRALRAPVEAPATLAEDVDGLLERAALQLLSIANKAGLVVTGAFKVDTTIEADVVAALIQATAGAPDGVQKRVRKLHAAYGETAAITPRIDLFSSAQLDLALGKANVVHVALKSGAAASAFLAGAERLSCYRASEGEPVTLHKADGSGVRSRRPDEFAEGLSD